MPLCSLCPRKCAAPRQEQAGQGRCRMGTLPVVARAALHFWEEPCISGTRGSGAVFFSGCALGCVYCQNEKISAGGFGRAVTTMRLREIYGELIAQGAHNINLVNPTHFSPAIARSLEAPLPVPVVYNCGGYEAVDALRQLEGKVQVYLPDLKYTAPGPAGRYSAAPDYPRAAKAAIAEMYRQRGPCVFSGDGLLQSGVLIRHLMLPGQAEAALDVIDFVADSFPPGAVLLSLMSQYIPCAGAARFPEINRPLPAEERRRVEEYLAFSPLEAGYVQEPGAAQEKYIPDFHLQGVEKSRG